MMSKLSRPTLVGSQNEKLASQRVFSAEEKFLASLEALNSEDIEKQSLAGVLLQTKESFDAGRTLWTVINAICKCGLCSSSILEREREILHVKLEMLFDCAQTFSVAAPEQVDDNIKAQLETVAMSCTRSVNRCVKASRKIFEFIGDFEFEFDGERLLLSSVDIHSSMHPTPQDAALPTQADPKELAENILLRERLQLLLPLGPQTPTILQIEEPKHGLSRTDYTDQLLWESDGKTESKIIAGTVDALVEHLTAADGYMDRDFLCVFWLTFRQFLSPEELAKKLMIRFRDIEGDPRRAGSVRYYICNAVMTWLEWYWRYETDAPTLQTLVLFTKEHLLVTNPQMARRIIGLATTATTSKPRYSYLASFSGRIQVPHTKQTIPHQALTKTQMVLLKACMDGKARAEILDFEGLEVARQLTIKTSKLFYAIQPQELLSKEWLRKDTTIAVNVRAMIASSTDISFFVSSTILRAKDSGKRMKVLKRWIKIANFCQNFGNFDTTMAIVGSLLSSPVQRLKGTWSELPPKKMNIWTNIKSIADNSANWKALRERLKQAKVKCIPFLGMYLTDLNFNDDGNPKTRNFSKPGSGENVEAINFSKYAGATRIISDLQSHQEQSRFEEVLDLQDWIAGQIEFMRTCRYDTDGDEFYKMSLTREPRPVQSHPGFNRLV